MSGKSCSADVVNSKGAVTHALGSWMNDGNNTYNITSYRGQNVKIGCGISGYVSGSAYVTWYFT